MGFILSPGGGGGGGGNGGPGGIGGGAGAILAELACLTIAFLSDGIAWNKLIQLCNNIIQLIVT